MTMPLRTFVTIVGLLVLTGCTGMKLEDFKGREPALVLEDYFEGQTQAWGIFEDRFGNLRREFRVDISGTWDGRTLVLDEHFDYADGEKDRRVWTIEKTGEGEYEGRADDVVGVAEGRVMGNALTWVYDVDLKIGDRTVRVTFDDWMFLQPDGVLINRARVSKFGIELGEVTLMFVKDKAMATKPDQDDMITLLGLDGQSSAALAR